MRVFCLTEADYCERRIQTSLSTPILLEICDKQDSAARLR
jgi:hypothetical protein